MESNTQKLEVRQPESAISCEIILSHDTVLPYDPHIQYAAVFASTEAFHSFFSVAEKMLEKHKLWLYAKVRHHILKMQANFSSINAV